MKFLKNIFKNSKILKIYFKRDYLFMQEIINELKKYDTVVLVGGGTGGHISPIISLFQKFSQQNPDKKFFWLGGKWGEEEKEAKKSGISFFGISVLKLSTTRSPKVFLYPFALIRTIFEAKKILKNLQKENRKIAIFSKGGPWALAIGIAGKILSIPLYIHESDTIPGRSNLQMWKISEKIFLGFESSKKFFEEKKCVVVGQILDEALQKENPEQRIFWKTEKPHILVFCGSQGARSVFEEIIQNCQNLDAEWIIILGKLNTGMRKNFEKFENIQIFDWLEKSEQKAIFEGMNLAITRGSATTLAELELFGVKKIIIPLPSAAKNHQFFNAKEYEKKWDILLEQKNIENLYKIISENI